jgi:hypothetical protein
VVCVVVGCVAVGTVLVGWITPTVIIGSTFVEVTGGGKASETSVEVAAFFADAE